MDLSEKDKFGFENRSGDHGNYHSSGVPPEWQFPNPSIAVNPDTQMASSSCPSVSMVDSFHPSLWNQAANSQHLGLCDNNGQSSTSTSSCIPIGRPVAGPPRLDMCWNPSESISKAGVFLGTRPGTLPPGLSHFPADSGFIERAARYSCFSGGNFVGMVNPFGANEPLSPYSDASKCVAGSQAQKTESNLAGAIRDPSSMPMDHGSNSGSPVKNLQDKGSESGEPELSGCGQGERAKLANDVRDSPSKVLAAKKRKRADQDMELEQMQGAPQLSAETKNDDLDSKQKGEQNNSTMATMKSSGKQAKESSDAMKEDYIHVRARRGQATNSHSLAERVRREKISERMKFLQDLVPGCSKVIGKAVMLDEIINYVQSLQRQVEFLSMKLSAVNPHLDFNIEGLLSKDPLQSRVGSSSTIGFSQDILHPQLHPSQHGLMQSGIPGMLNPSDAIRRAISAQLTMISGYKDPTNQMPNTWNDELNNVIHMNYGANSALNIQDINGKPHDGFPL